jgi:hypothetical protein
VKKNPMRRNFALLSPGDTTSRKRLKMALGASQNFLPEFTGQKINKKIRCAKNSAPRFSEMPPKDGLKMAQDITGNFTPHTRGKKNEKGEWKNVFQKQR